MPYSTAEARQEVLDLLVRAGDELSFALASAGAAYEAVDETTGDRIEEDLFGPVQGAYARARRAHSGFAGRHGLASHDFAPAQPGAPSRGPHGFLEDAADGVAGAEAALTELQDSEHALEVGDAELRADVSELRRALAPLPERNRALLRTLGR